MKKIAAALAVTLALTATAYARPQLHQRAATSTIDSGYAAPSNWNDIEVSIPSGGL